MEKAAGASGGAGAGSECEGEDQDESSSSSHFEALDAFDRLTLEDDQKSNSEDDLSEFRNQWQRELQATPSPQREPPLALSQDQALVEDKEDELSVFRSQWQRELGATPSPQRVVPRTEPEKEEEPQTEEEKAKQLFLRGVEFERGGKLYEAIQHYKRAMQILPDVETRLYESSKERAETPEVEAETEATAPVARPPADLSDDEEAVPGEDLLTRMRRLVARRGRLCEPEFNTRGAHISWLPYEVVLLIMRWVVSADLDAASLERLGATCRGLYVAAREPDLWRSLALRTWGIECGTPRGHGFDSWRGMYLARTRLQLHGLYISKTSYLRHGENSFQDQSYRPWYLIDYYRYLRFFPEGLVTMLTTADEPTACVAVMRQRSARPQLGLMAGHYRLIGDKVVIVIKKASEKRPVQTNTRFRPRRKDLEPTHEQIFHMELEVRSVRSRRNCQLHWRRYAVSPRRDQWTAFDLSPAKFPPFAFSRVRQYSAEAYKPLP